MNNSSDHARIALLVDRITSGSVDVGPLANDVLAGFLRGLPVQMLLPLVHHADTRVAEVGTWIAAELGPSAAPLLDEITGLMGSSSRVTRFYAIDVVQATALGDRGDRAARVLPLLADDDSAVRWKATGFLARASPQQLQSALGAWTATDTHDVHAALLRWLLSASGRDPSAIRDRLAADEALTRRYAVAAAARLSDVIIAPLETATTATDEEVSRFARDWLGILGGTIQAEDHEQPGNYAPRDADPR